MTRFARLSAFGLALALAAPASSHIALTKSVPAAKAAVARPGRIVLSFNDKLVATQFRSELVMISMPGMADHPPMKISAYTSQVSADGKSITLLMKQALPAGGYVLKWKAAGADGHPVSGELPFSVR